MFANMKHCVAMGGAGWGAMGSPAAPFKFSAAAAGAGISRPVPKRTS